MIYASHIFADRDLTGLEHDVKYRVVIFDFDGTLADSLPWFAEATNMLAATHRYKRIEAGEIDTLRHSSARQIMQRLGVPLWKLPLIARDMQRLTAENLHRIALFAGVDQMLRELAQAGVILAIVSSNSATNIRHVLGAELAALFSYYECGASVFGKRSRFRRIRRQSGAQPNEILCVGDELRDWEAADKEQLPFGAVAWGFTHIAALEARAPAEVFTRIDEIVPRVAE